MDGTVPFGGVDDHYFLSAALPKTQPVATRVPSQSR